MKIPVYILVDDNHKERCDEDCPFLLIAYCDRFKMDLFERLFAIERCDRCLKFEADNES